MARGGAVDAVPLDVWSSLSAVVSGGRLVTEAIGGLVLLLLGGRLLLYRRRRRRGNVCAFCEGAELEVEGRQLELCPRGVCKRGHDGRWDLWDVWHSGWW